MKSDSRSRRGNVNVVVVWLLLTLLLHQCPVTLGARLRGGSGGGSELWRSALIDGSNSDLSIDMPMPMHMGHHHHQHHHQQHHEQHEQQLDGLVCPWDEMSAASACPASTANNQTTPVCQYHAAMDEYETVCLKTHAIAQDSAWLPHAHSKSYCGVCKKCFQDRLELKAAIDQYKSYTHVNTELAEVYGWPIGKWCVDNVTSFSNLFFKKSKFNEDISQWQTSQVTDMTSMFQNAYSFNKPLNTWDTSKVSAMTRMFAMGIHFDQDISSWDVSSVTDFGYMFLHAQEFNQDISKWKVHNARHLVSMFFGATQFEQNHLQEWEISEHADTQNLCQWDDNRQYHHHQTKKNKKDSATTTNNTQQNDKPQSQQPL
ncbi:(LipO)protein [Seminavis robusta]|uniref:(LipO)protein n=1 Tax=Seminavis robusta TaxID=568900 RepID=A0A9N8HMS6_9STRA|nr:(LipO)protein [Seminavis robusta]|eukprot:Sro1145_g246220.1 (LipO)protein (372) ;mRNA; f:19668-20978